MRIDIQALGFDLVPALRARTGRAAGNACGARELSVVDGLLRGSVARQIIHNARGAVLVAPAPAAPEEKMAC